MSQTSSPEQPSNQTSKPKFHISYDTGEEEWTVGEVTFISSDGYTLRAEKFALGYHSLTFRDMLNLPLREDSIKLEEDGETLANLLRVMHRNTLNSIDVYGDELKTVDLNKRVLKAAQKYQLHYLLPHFENYLLQLVQEYQWPLSFHFFIIGCQEHWVKLCKECLLHMHAIGDDFEDYGPANGHPWNWTSEQIDSIGSKRFLDFVKAHSHAEAFGKAEGVALKDSDFGGYARWGEKVSAAFKFSD